MKGTGKRTLACTLALSFFLSSGLSTVSFADEMVMPDIAIAETDFIADPEYDGEDVIVDSEIEFDESDDLLDENESDYFLDENESDILLDEGEAGLFLDDGSHTSEVIDESGLLFELSEDVLLDSGMFEEDTLFAEESGNEPEFLAEAPAFAEVRDIDLPSSEELFDQYLEKEMYDGIREEADQLYSVDYSGRGLNGPQKSIYAKLKNEITLVAKGQKREAIFTFTVDELKGKTITRSEVGSNLITSDGYITSEAANALLTKYVTRAILDALTLDCPFEMYWFDKTVGYSYEADARYRVSGTGKNPTDVLSYATSPEMTFYFFVEEEFMPSGVKSPTCKLDSTKTGAALKAVQNAKNYAANVANQDDLTQYTYFKNVICDLVDYNYPAAEGDMPYGNPWQLIWVFDQDPSTDVVCEGYSKAFQYLCELNGLPCISVSGNSGGPHMWNVAKLSDGRNYLVDLTNCDDDGIGYPDKLFLTPMTGNVYQGYEKQIDLGNGRYETARYSYDSDIINSFPLSWLRISNLPYGQKQEMLPTPVLKSVKPSGNRVAISWGAVDGVDVYRVYRRIHGESNWSILKDVIATEYIDVNVISGTTYEYTVRGVTIDELALTSYDKTGKGIRYLGRPGSIKVSNVDGGPKISWNAVSGAAKYNVYRKTGSEGWTCVKSTTDTSVKDTSAAAGIEYAYTVRAIASGYDENGVKKTFTSDYNRNGVKIVFVDEVKVASLTNTATGITVKWNSTAGAAGYYVYRKISGGSYQKIATVGSSTKSYTDTVDLLNGTVYDYAVRAYYGSYLGTYTALRTVRLAMPTISSCSNSASGTVTVNWNKNGKATGYQIGYKLGSTLNTITIRSNATVTGKVTGLRKGETYSFYVRSYKNVSGKNYYSAWSKVKSLKITK